MNTGNISLITVVTIDGETALWCGKCDGPFWVAHEGVRLQTMARQARNHVTQAHGSFRSKDGRINR